MSIVGDSFSVPTTSIVAAPPPRIMSAAAPSAYPNPAHPAERSNPSMPLAPSDAATIGAAGGVCRKWVLVVTITPSMSAADRPAFDSARRQASVAMEAADSSSAANRRVLMPVRV
ncbi:Uncharacterised protein [Mycobacterium tuberculosis]|nr:Uncharacterised protein [Mycobacterium tuberculosis]